MKKLLTAMLLLTIIACSTDNGVSPEDNFSKTVKKSNQTIILSSSSMIEQSSSSSFRRTISEEDLPQVTPVIISSSSSKTNITLDEICDMAAAEVLNASNMTSKTKACAEYKTYLINVIEMKTADINYCMEYETCTTTDELPACNMRSINVIPNASNEYLQSLCASFKAQGYYNFQNCDCTATIK